MWNEESILKYLVSDGRDIMIKYLGVASCVSSTRVVIEVLRNFGIPAQPQPVHAVAMGRGVIVGRTPGAKAKYWNGHLVAATESHLIDASLDQVDFLIPAYFEHQEFPNLQLINTTAVVYFKDTEAEDYTKIEGWKDLWVPPYLDIMTELTLNLDMLNL